MRVLSFPQLSFLLVSIFVALIHYGETYPSHLLDVFKKDAGTSTPAGLVQFVSLERSAAPNGNRFTLKFTKDVDDVRITVQDNQTPPRAPDSVTQESDGVWAASFVLPHIPDDHSQWVIFTDPEIYHLAAIMLNNTGSGSAAQNITEQPVIHVTPDTEAVYNPGEDVLIKGFVPRNTETGEVVSNMQKTFMGLDLNTMQFETDLDTEGLFTMRPPEELADRIQANMTIHTSTHPVSGYLQLSTDVPHTGGSLAAYIQVSRSIIVRPSNQTGPYPEGFLMINNFHTGQTSPNGHQLQTCRVGSSCLIHCFASGEAISGMEVKEVLSDGSLANVPSAQVHAMATSTSSGVFWNFQAEQNSGDSQGITTFQCKVFDDSHGTHVTKLIDVQAAIDASIDSAESGVTVEDDPTDPSKTRVTFHCAIQGRPLPPDVYFEGYAYHMYGEAPDTVVSTGQDEAVATKTITGYTEDLIQSNAEVLAGHAPAPSCAFHDPITSNYVKHTFSVPDFSPDIMAL